MRRIAVAVLAAGAVVAVVAGCGGAGAGPFAWPSDAGTTTIGSPVRSGQTFAMTIVLPRTSTTPAVLLDVNPLHPEDARALTLRYGATTGLGLELARTRGWSSRKYQVRPLAGFVIPAHVVGGVTIGAASKRRGVHKIRGFVVDYRIGDRRYSATMQMNFALCVGMRQCPSRL